MIFPRQEEREGRLNDTLYADDLLLKDESEGNLKLMVGGLADNSKVMMVKEKQDLGVNSLVMGGNWNMSRS